MLNDPKFAAATYWFEKACEASREHALFARQMLAKYGSHGPDVSGCVRDHFPDHIKESLRNMARNVSRYSDNAHASRPRYVRETTMRKLARMVAQRDGSGFYGPQA